jgi:PadR family transcriptional regulator, regulatory protein PadR
MPAAGMLLAMREATFIVLTALAAGPSHGYGIMREVNELSDGRLTLRTSTLYAALDRLAEEGLITVDREEAVAGRLRRYYRLTETGGAALATAAARQQRIAASALQRLRGSGFGLAPA